MAEQSSNTDGGQKFISLTGVTCIRPASNENSLIVTFWNGGSVAVSSGQDVGITNSNEVILWGER